MSYRLKYLINKLIMKAFLFPENDPRYKNPGKIIKKLTTKSKDFYHRI